ncbi:hypothetical protein J4476_03535 [Candidatus Woesearchaeota archaeon]|nr:MAG: hypothetical protein QT09_C0006G0088 [archaeon GW2011_AR18]MBS3161740.1 hypothetical protein [Candidatus Woesearchaeota archaeon]HIH26304.1 hypothetical protein [Nanoarchaeota archaeon]
MRLLKTILAIAVLSLPSYSTAREGDPVIKPSYTLESEKDLEFLDGQLRTPENLEQLSKIAYSNPPGTPEAGAYIILENENIKVSKAENAVSATLLKLENIINKEIDEIKARDELDTIITNNFLKNGDTTCAPSNMNDIYWKQNADRFAEIRYELHNKNLEELRRVAVQVTPIIKNRYFMEEPKNINYIELARMHTHNNGTGPSEIDICLSRETGFNYLVLSYDFAKAPNEARIYALIKGKVKILGNYNLKKPN